MLVSSLKILVTNYIHKTFVRSQKAKSREVGFPESGKGTLAAFRGRQISYFSYGAQGLGASKNVMKTGDKSIPLQVTDVGYVADSCKQPSTAIYNNLNPPLQSMRC
jgi:hypothetical protein